jgi:hypothetical protein
MDLLWKYTFSELKASPKEVIFFLSILVKYPILLTEPIMNPLKEKV